MADILRALYRHAAANSDETAFKDDKGAVTWPELAARVSAFSKELSDSPAILGLYGDNDINWIIALLAGWQAGRTVVPLPTHFSKTQLLHVLEDTGIRVVISTRRTHEVATSLGVDVRSVTDRRCDPFGETVGGGGLIIYTSGSTGAPKGVRLDLHQINWQAKALSHLIKADRSDVHLSVLPLSLLLEIICAIGVPILAGARTHLATDMARAVAEGRASGLAALFNQQLATATVLVPQLLTAWVAELEAADKQAPDGLRFVAVGGAPVSAALAERAWQLGIPVHEGYGLSECCSVVAVNVPNHRKPGTVGLPLPGFDVSIENGEIVVGSPMVMKGYLNGTPVGRSWRTGDLGHLDADGFLTVTGRKDNLLVTSFGRNISPEWIEAMLTADARINTCAVLGHGERQLKVFLVPSTVGEAWLTKSPRAQVQLWIESMCADAPSYAVPKDFAVCTLSSARKRGLFTANGQIARAAAQRAYGEFRQSLLQIAT